MARRAARGPRRLILQSHIQESIPLHRVLAFKLHGEDLDFVDCRVKLFMALSVYGLVALLELYIQYFLLKDVIQPVVEPLRHLSGLRLP